MDRACLHVVLGVVVAWCLYEEVTRSVHHVYVCSSDRHPLAVVTPHDVLRLVADRLVEG